MHACAALCTLYIQVSIHGCTAHPAQQQWLSWQAQTHMRAHSLQSMQNRHVPYSELLPGVLLQSQRGP